MPPKSDGSGQDRALLGQAFKLLQAAGCKRDGNVLKLPSGEPFRIEFLDFGGSLERHTNPFIKNLRLLGIDAKFRVVDAAQYQSRVQDFDFDVVTLPLRRELHAGRGPADRLRLGGRQDAGLAELHRHRRSGRRRADREGPGGQTRGRSSTPSAECSTACCAPAITGCRCGTTRTTGWPIGTSSAGPPHRRNSIRACSRPGGSTPRRH